jgi:cephalosporin-C deacetylase
MPNIDMPLDELVAYRGISPRPDGFDRFWSDGLDEVKNTEPNVEVMPASFQIKGYEFSDVFFNGVRGARIHAKMIRPSKQNNLPIVLHFHGYTGRAGDWNEYLPFAAAGFCVLAMDCRGQGGLSTDSGGVSGNTLHGHIIRGLGDGPDKLLFRHIFLDTAQLAAVAMGFDFTDESKVFAYGASQGGALTLVSAALVPQISLLAPVYPFLCDYKRVWEMALPSTAYKEIYDYFRMFDPLHKRRDEIFNTLGYIDVVHLAKRIKGRTLFAVSLNDDVTPPSTCFAAYNNIAAEKELYIYPDFSHEGLPGFLDTVLQEFHRNI